MTDNECGVLWCKNTATVVDVPLKGNIKILLCQEHKECLYGKEESK